MESTTNNNLPANSNSEDEDEFHDALDDDTNGYSQKNVESQVIPVTVEENNNVDLKDFNQLADLIYKTQASAGPKSFLDVNVVPSDSKIPPPVYFSEKILKEQLPSDFNEVMKSFKKTDQGCLVCTDETIMEKQKGVLYEVAKQLAIHILKGLTISHISVPVKIFEPRSSIQRIVDQWSAAPVYLTKAAQLTDPIERFKNVIVFSLASVYLCCGQNKPFNPLLGETHQGTFSDGTKFYCEHTSHHPPITHFLVEGANNAFKMYGYYEIAGKLGKNSFTSSLAGPTTIVFHDGQKICFSGQGFRLGGTIMGERTIEPAGAIQYEDAKNGLKSIVKYGTFKKSGYWNKKVTGGKDCYEGILYQTNGQFEPTQFDKNTKIQSDKLDKLPDMYKKIDDISGSYLEFCQIGKEIHWNKDSYQPFRQQNLLTDEVLSSDWRYREDLIWLKYENLQLAAAWKQRLEVQQRRDRKNRQDVEKKRAK